MFGIFDFGQFTLNSSDIFYRYMVRRGEGQEKNPREKLQKHVFG